MTPLKKLRSVFNRVSSHLLRQNAKAETVHNVGVTSSTTCVYRMKDGRRCAIGCLIPKPLYTPRIEGVSMEDIRNHYGDRTNKLARKIDMFTQTLIDSGLGPETWDLLDALQEIHDMYDVEQWEDELYRLDRELKEYL